MKKAIDSEEEDAPKNPFKGILGDDEESAPDDGEDGDDYPVTPEEVAAAGEVRRAIDGGSDEELAKAICVLVKLHGGG